MHQFTYQKYVESKKQYLSITANSLFENKVCIMDNHCNYSWSQESMAFGKNNNLGKGLPQTPLPKQTSVSQPFKSVFSKTHFRSIKFRHIHIMYNLTFLSPPFSISASFTHHTNETEKREEQLGLGSDRDATCSPPPPPPPPPSSPLSHHQSIQSFHQRWSW